LRRSLISGRALRVKARLLARNQTPAMGKQKKAKMKTTMEETFGPVITCYSRAQAIEDGVLVDMSEAITPCPFKYPVAMTIAAYTATIAAVGNAMRD
jgi:hypothetical protein